MERPLIVRTVYALSAFVLITTILYFTKLLFMPLAMAGVLALVFMPLSDLLEKRGMNRVFASLICGLVFILFMSGIIALLMWHVKNIARDLAPRRRTEFLGHDGSVPAISAREAGCDIVQTGSVAPGAGDGDGDGRDRKNGGSDHERLDERGRQPDPDPGLYDHAIVPASSF